MSTWGTKGKSMVSENEWVVPSQISTWVLILQCQHGLLFSSSVVSDSLQPRDCSLPGFPVLHHLLELAETHVHWVGDAIQPSHPLSSPSPPAFNLSQHESALHIRWPEYWSFSFSISPSNEYSGLVFFRMDWLDLLTVQGTLESLLQYHNSKATILQCSAFFMVQLPSVHDY